MKPVKRAYGSEPVLLAASPITTALSAQQSRRKKRLVSLVFAGSLLVVLAAGAVLWGRHNTASLLPPSVRQVANYPLYRPGWLPAGARLDPASVDATPQVVTFAFLYGGNKKLIFTEQPKPDGFDFDAFYSDQLTGKQTFATAAGQATTGLFEGSAFASLVTDSTWIIMRAPTSTQETLFDHIVRSLRIDN